MLVVESPEGGRTSLTFKQQVYVLQYYCTDGGMTADGQKKKKDKPPFS